MGKNNCSINMSNLEDHIKNDIPKRLNDAEIEKYGISNSLEFPIDAFPLKIQEIIKSLEGCLKYPTEYTGASILAVSSLAIGNSFEVMVKKGWNETCNLIVVIVGNAGANKSHPLKFALIPIKGKDDKSIFEFNKKWDEYEMFFSISKKERNEKANDEPKKPILKKILCSDTTIEALAEIHHYNKRGIGLYVDELMSWLKNFNRYNKGSEQEFWLSSWSKAPINIDRKSSMKSLLISKPFITVVGTLQTKLLDELAKDNRNKNGFIDRILFVFSNKEKKEYWSEKELPEEIEKKYVSIINKLLDLEQNINKYGNPVSQSIMLNPDAKKELFEWQKINTDIVNELRDEDISGIYSKMEIYVPRLALVLQMLSWACGEAGCEEINYESTIGAIKLAEYFKKTAENVNFLINCSNPIAKLPKDKQLLYSDLPENFSTQEGVKIAKEHGFPERSFKRFLRNEVLFENSSRGKYRKLL